MRMFKQGLLRKLMVSYSILFLIIVMIIVVVAYRYIADVSEKTAEINQIQFADKLVNQIEVYLNEMHKMAKQIKADSRIVNTFSTLQKDKDNSNYFEKDILENIEIGSILTSHNGPDAPIWRISVYNQYGDYISAGAPVPLTSQNREHLNYTTVCSLIDSFRGNAIVPLLLPPQADHWSSVYDAKYISLLLPITDYYANEIYGIVEIQQPAETLATQIILNIVPDLQFYLFEGENQQILPETPLFFEVKNGDFSIVRKEISDYKWTFVLVQSRESMLRPYRSILVYMLLGGVVLVVVMVTVVYIISKRISAPLVSLSKKVRETSIGSMPKNWIESESTDEVMELGNAFSSLLKRLTDSVELEKKAYLQSLQSQMNPHFLFNSLSMLSGMGMEAGSDAIVNTCAMISDMMRYSTDASLSTLGKEADNLRNYLDLMKLRYEDQFSYSIRMDLRLDSMPIARLVLQPVVENCFEHGFKLVPPPWRIDVLGTLTQTGWEVSITDNGSGFAQAHIELLNEKVHAYIQNLPENYAELKIGGLGLANTIIRLKLFSGAQCFIEDAQPRGTRFRIVGNAL